MEDLLKGLIMCVMYLFNQEKGEFTVYAVVFVAVDIQ